MGIKFEALKEKKETVLSFYLEVKDDLVTLKVTEGLSSWNVLTLDTIQGIVPAWLGDEPPTWKSYGFPTDESGNYIKVTHRD